MAAATSSSAPKLALVQGRSPLALVDKVESLNTELGLTSAVFSDSAVSIPSAVEAIAAILGMAEAINQGQTTHRAGQRLLRGRLLH